MSDGKLGKGLVPNDNAMVCRRPIIVRSLMISSAPQISLLRRKIKIIERHTHYWEVNLRTLTDVVR